MSEACIWPQGKEGCCARQITYLAPQKDNLFGADVNFRAYWLNKTQERRKKSNWGKFLHKPGILIGDDLLILRDDRVADSSDSVLHILERKNTD